jgi:thiol-disulfide isomerase/thioredoxin
MKVLFLIIFSVVNSAEKINEVSLPIYNSDKTYHLKNDNGGKKTVVNFWASWCTACIQELDELEQLKKKHPEYNYLAINAGEKKKKIKKFMKKYKFSYQILLDKNKRYSKSMGVLELPKTMVFDSDLTILYNSKVPPKELK